MMIKYWKLAMTEHYAKFSGRASRPEFWWMYLANAIVGWILAILASATDSPFFWVIYVVWVLAIFIPTLAAGIRRLHDTGRSGAWVLIVLIPFVGGIVLIVFLASAGSAGPNQFGPPPTPLPA